MTWSDFINQEIVQLGGIKFLVGNVLLGIVVLLCTWGFVILLRNTITKPKFIIDKIDQKRRISVFMISKYIIWIVSISVTLKVIGIRDLSVLLLGSTALLVGIGLGFQNIFKDLISGLFLLFEGTIKIGDIIEVDGEVGKVMDINLRSSELFTRDDVTIIIPNSKFIVEKVVNWSHESEKVRFEVNVSVAYGSDVEKVFTCLEEVMKDNSRVMAKPVPFVRFIDFVESSLNFQMIFWSKEIFRIENVKSDIRREVYKKLAENNLTIPFPQRDLHIKGIEHILKKQKEQDN